MLCALPRGTGQPVGRALATRAFKAPDPPETHGLTCTVPTVGTTSESGLDRMGEAVNMGLSA